MSFNSLLLCTLFVLVRSDEFFNKDGPCPPPPSPIANFQKASGSFIWYDTSTNYERAKTTQNERSCKENRATANEDGVVFLETRYTDSNGPNQVLYKRFDPVEGQLGRFDSNIPTADGGWKSHGWRYTVVGEDGDSFMEYGCKAFGDKHRDFYRTRSRSVAGSEASTLKLQQIALANGDQREFLKFKHENCQYQLKN